MLRRPALMIVPSWLASFPVSARAPSVVVAGAVLGLAGAGCSRASDRPPPRPEGLVAPPNSSGGGLRGEGEGEGEPFPATPPPVEGLFPDLDPEDGVPDVACELPADTSGTVEVIAADADATEIVAATDAVYWLAVHDDDDSDLVRFVDGVEPEIVTAAGARPVGLRIGAGAAFWVEDVAGGRVMASLGAGAIVLAVDQIEPGAVDSNGDDVCWGASGALRCSHVGGSDEAVRLFEGLQDIADVRIAGDGFVYWADRAANGRVNRVALAGGIRQVMLADLGPPDAFQFDRGDAFVRTGSTVYRITDEGGTIDVVTVDARHFTLDADTIYWASNDGAVRRRLREGGGVGVIVADEASPAAIAVDACFVYWTDATGSVQRARK